MQANSICYNNKHLYIEFIEINIQKHILQIYTSIYTRADGSPC